jgi:electron transfer flavoprotein beta subunit
MKILVPSKRVPDPDQRIRIAASGHAIEKDELPFVLNPFDAISIEEALRIRDENRAGEDEGEVVVVGIGEEAYEKELRTAMAMGADRALLVECETAPDPWNVARILQAVVEREQPALILMGKQAVDDDSNQVGQFLAALLDWPQATFASKIEFDAGRVRVTRETDMGIETVSMELPAVITADLRLNEPRYASLPAIMKAKRKPVDRIACADLGIAIEPRVRILEMEPLVSKRNCVQVSSGTELLARLRDEVGVL